MDGLSYERDIRHEEPNENKYRFGTFKQGWAEAIDAKRQPYNEETLRDLTWKNLGYRLGKIFGPTSPDQIEQMYDWCVRQQQHRRK